MNIRKEDESLKPALYTLAFHLKSLGMKVRSVEVCRLVPADGEKTKELNITIKLK